jgi:hypothetical protein
MPAEFFEADSSLGISNELVVMIDKPTTVGNSNYDHFVYQKNSRAKALTTSGKVLKDFDHGDVDEKSLYKAEVSDHLPIAASFMLE